jgi:hypothetical protein
MRCSSRSMENSGVISPVSPGLVKSGRGVTLSPILANSYPGSRGFEFAFYIGMDIAGCLDIYLTHVGCNATTWPSRREVP